MVTGINKLLFNVKYSEHIDMKKKRNMLKTQTQCKQFKMYNSLQWKKDRYAVRQTWAPGPQVSVFPDESVNST
jgi:predicted ribosome quality control (RQC) complex YloA/Tae2 family protein